MCPTLLAQECKYCHHNGHTPKFCPALIAKKAGVKKPYCSICHRSGKSEETYTSHWPRDSIGGVVTCPTLLTCECRYCHQLGHTPKYCPRLAAKNAASTQVGGTDGGYTGSSHPSNAANATNPETFVFPTQSDGSIPLNSVWVNGRCASANFVPIVQSINGPARAEVSMEVHTHLMAQQFNEEYVSSWAGRSTAYTAEEEATACDEMEKEAEFQEDLSIWADRCDEMEEE